MTEIKRAKDNTDKTGGLIFKGMTTFRICSPWPELLNRLAEGLLAAQFFRVGSQVFRLAHAELLPPPSFEETMNWHPIKPASIVTSWSDRKQQRKTSVLPDQPVEGQTVEQLLAYNLFHKWQRLSEIRPDITDAWNTEGHILQHEDIHIECLPIDAGKPCKMKFHSIKGSPIKSWISPIRMNAPPPIQRVAWACGLGEMNSMGFGVMEEDS